MKLIERIVEALGLYDDEEDGIEEVVEKKPIKEEKPEPKKTTLEAAELKNHLRAFKMLVESVADNEQYDKKKMSELVDAGLEQLIQIVDDFAVKKETKEEKDQREMDEFKDILDSI